MLEQATPDAPRQTERTGGDLALENDLRALTLLNLGTIEASLALPDAERHLREGRSLAQDIGRPYLELGCLAQLGCAARIRPFATTQQRIREAIEFAERHGWGEEPIIAPALVTLAGTLAWTGRFDEAEHWLRRTARVVAEDTGPDIGMPLHMVSGMIHACLGRHREALPHLRAAERLHSLLTDSHAVANQVTGWLLATQARAGMLDEARAALAGLDDHAGEIRNARAAIHLAEDDPAAALTSVRAALDGTAPVVGYVTLVETHLLAAHAHRRLGDRPAAQLATERALALAEADQLVLPFAMTGATELLRALARRDTAHRALLIHILDLLRGPPATADARSAAGATATLSPSELRVLRYLPTNLSRPEIAAELSVSLNTVSTHIRSIYTKLGVGDRTSAVRRAQTLGTPGTTGQG
ncbi:MAG TPA: LuxR C-terminal-related transcriptional regulator [Pseudonocardia sp.]|nr:LuxR C-terminal-related transcriptional regulator [Pseudonocardia sp.]